MPPAARVTDSVEHGFGAMGMLAGALAGAIVAAAIIGTGGTALFAAAAVLGATAGGGLIGGKAAQGIGILFGNTGMTSGAITAYGSSNVFIGGKPAARAGIDAAGCDGVHSFHHPVMPPPTVLIAQGSTSVHINGRPAARVGDKLICGGDIKTGQSNVIIGGDTTDMLAINDPEDQLRNLLIGMGALSALLGVAVAFAGVTTMAGFFVALGAVVRAVAVGAAFSYASNAALKYLPPGWNLIGSAAVDAVGLVTMAKLLEALGDPIYPPTGEVISQSTDFVLPGALELRFERYYASALDQSDWFGPNWTCNWGQRVVNTGAGVVYYYPGDGRRVIFELDTPPDPQGWLRNRETPKLRLRPTLTGFAVLTETGLTQHLDRTAGNTSLITAIEDRNGNNIRFYYSDTGALRVVDHSGGYRLRVDGTPSHITSIALETIGGNLEPLARYAYDPAGCLTGVDNGSGQFLRYEYDSYARMTRWSDRLVSFTEYVYDEQGRCIESGGPDGMLRYSFSYNTDALMTTAIDSYGGVIQVFYDDRKRVIAVHDQNGNTTTTIYDEWGNKTVITDPTGRRIQNLYDANGNLVSATNAAGETTQFEYNELRLPVTIIDPAGQRWRRGYDERGNVVEAGLEGVEPWSYQYNERGNLVAATDPTGITLRYTYNAAGLLATATDGTGQTTRYQRDPLGRVVAASDPLGHQTQFRYNGLRKLGLVVLPDEGHLHWRYDPEGNVTERKGADGGTYHYTYGIYDQLQTIERPAGSKLHFTYDLEARLTQVTNERGETWDYSFDKAGRLIYEKEFSGRSQRYRYDLAGFLIERTNGNDEKTVIERDKAGRILKKISADGDVAEFAYNANGFLTRAQNQWTTIEFERDEYGRVIREKQGDHVIESSYDARGLRTHRLIKSGTVPTASTAWHYDAAGRLTALNLPTNDCLEFKRDAVGRDIVRQLTNSPFALQQRFDSMHRLTGQRASNGNNLQSERHWQYDANGDPTSINESLWGESSFHYNYDGRLTDAARQNGLSQHFSYDEAGAISAVRTGGFRDWQTKRPSLGKVELRFIDKGGRLEKVGEQQFTYDSDGRTLEKRVGEKVSRYEWTSEGQLRAVVTPEGDRWTYEYDPFGRRIKKSGPSGETVYVWDGAGIAQEITPERSSSWFFEPGSFRPMAKVENGKVYACITDQVGTPRELMTRDGKLAWAASFTAFGALESLKAEETSCPIRFQGHWFDEESGLHYNFNRYYNPQTGTYLSPDPSGLKGGALSYSYVHNPLSWIDPFGLAACPPRAGIGKLHYYSPESLHQGNPHFSVETIGPETTIHTEQGRMAPDGTMAITIHADLATLPPPAKTAELQLPDVDAAQQLQNDRIGKQLGKYNVRSNNCLTGAADVLRAGGVDVPTNPADMRIWTRQLFGDQ